MGSYPAVSAVHSPAHDREPYLLATIGDGTSFGTGKRRLRGSMPGQFGGNSDIYKITNTSEGTLVFEEDGNSLQHWRLSANGWER